MTICLLTRAEKKMQQLGILKGMRSHQQNRKWKRCLKSITECCMEELALHKKILIQSILQSFSQIEWEAENYPSSSTRSWLMKASWSCFLVCMNLPRTPAKRSKSSTKIITGAYKWHYIISKTRFSVSFKN